MTRNGWKRAHLEGGTSGISRGKIKPSEGGRGNPDTLFGKKLSERMRRGSEGSLD